MLLTDILVHPDTYETLKVDWQNHTIHLSDNAVYKAGFKNGVPYVLPVRDTLLQSSSIHSDHQTEFHYQEHYEQDARVFDYFQPLPGRVDEAERFRLNQMIINSIPGNVTSILDVGCGNGWLSRSMVSDATTVISMDISFHNPVEALKHHPHPRHEALIADVYHLPLKENSIDCIVASEILEHVPDPALFIERLLTVLRPGGKLIITTPYNEQIEYHLCVHCNRATPAHAHLHSFNEDNISSLIPEDVRSWNWITFSHKYMSKSRIYLLMKRLPFGMWSAVDKTANKVWQQPMRLMMEIVKG